MMPEQISEKTFHPGARSIQGGATDNKKRQEQRYLPTLFDRLCDDAPSERKESSETYSPTRSQMRDIVLRDLAYLLNTTNQSDLLDRNKYPAAVASTINYGVPALAGGYLSEKKWRDIEQMIRHAILTFEPRLLSETLIVRPLLKSQASANYNVLTFEISGHIQMQPYPMEFMVQSNVDLETNRIELLHR
jgi:type VI secretion system protein ImpF